MGEGGTGRVWECTPTPLLPPSPLLGQEDYQFAPCCTLSGVHFHRDENDFHPPSASTYTPPPHSSPSILPSIHRVGCMSQSFSHYIIMSQGKAVWTGDKLDQVLRRRERVFISYCLDDWHESHHYSGCTGFYSSSFLSFPGRLVDDIRLTIQPGVTS